MGHLPPGDGGGKAAVPAEAALARAKSCFEREASPPAASPRRPPPSRGLLALTTRQSAPPQRARAGAGGAGGRGGRGGAGRGARRGGRRRRMAAAAPSAAGFFQTSSRGAPRHRPGRQAPPQHGARPRPALALALSLLPRPGAGGGADGVANGFGRCRGGSGVWRNRSRVASGPPRPPPASFLPPPPPTHPATSLAGRGPTDTCRCGGRSGRVPAACRGGSAPPAPPRAPRPPGESGCWEPRQHQQQP